MVNQKYHQPHSKICRNWWENLLATLSVTTCYTWDKVMLRSLLLSSVFRLINVCNNELELASSSYHKHFVSQDKNSSISSHLQSCPKGFCSFLQGPFDCPTETNSQMNSKGPDPVWKCQFEIPLSLHHSWQGLRHEPHVWWRNLAHRLL